MPNICHVSLNAFEVAEPPSNRDSQAKLRELIVSGQLVHSLGLPVGEPTPSTPGALAEASDAELARALSNGEAAAYLIAWQRFLPLVKRMVGRVFGSGADFEDVVQEIFFCLFRRIHTLREPAALRAFVIAIASRTLSHERRRRRARFYVDVETEEGTSEALRVVADPAAKHALLSLQQLVGRLRNRERMAFLLRYVEGMDAAEVASKLGVSAPTARRSFSRAMKRINVWAGRDPFLADYLQRGAAKDPS